MTERSVFSRIALIAGGVGLLLLGGCLLRPGRFTASLILNQDRTFTFAYKGEVVAVDPANDLSKGLGGLGKGRDEDDTGDVQRSTFAGESPANSDEKAESKQEQDSESALDSDDNQVKNRAIAQALSKERGFRSAVYRGNNVFEIDYQITGRLDHSFVFPYNSDAKIMTPFLSIEPRIGGTVRVRAPGFSPATEGTALPGRKPRSNQPPVEGRFTLTTNAEIVSQNNENGVTPGPGGKTITWQVTPLTSDTPTAVLKLAPLP